MSLNYATYFIPANQTIAHLGSLVTTLHAQLQMQYTGFAAVSAVTVYELAIKEIFLEFAVKKNKVFGHFVDKYFHRMNGRIGLDDIKGQVARFGDKYSKRFDKLLSDEEKRYLQYYHESIKSSYGNIIAWRHEFAHQGKVPTNATFREVQSSYFYGKIVIEVLAKTLVR